MSDAGEGVVHDREGEDHLHGHDLQREKTVGGGRESNLTAGAPSKPEALARGGGGSAAVERAAPAGRRAARQHGRRGLEGVDEGGEVADQMDDPAEGDGWAAGSGGRRKERCSGSVKRAARGWEGAGGCGERERLAQARVGTAAEDDAGHAVGDGGQRDDREFVVRAAWQKRVGERQGILLGQGEGAQRSRRPHAGSRELERGAARLAAGLWVGTLAVEAKYVRGQGPLLGQLRTARNGAEIGGAPEVLPAPRPQQSTRVGPNNLASRDAPLPKGRSILLFGAPPCNLAGCPGTWCPPSPAGPTGQALPRLRGSAAPAAAAAAPRPSPAPPGWGQHASALGAASSFGKFVGHWG